MISLVFFSDDVEPLTWSEARSRRFEYGPKGAMLAALPRPWTPPFALIAASIFNNPDRDARELLTLGGSVTTRLRSLAVPNGCLIVRSSIIGETIWDRGTYKSEVIDAGSDAFESKLIKAAANVLTSAGRETVGLVVQRHVPAKAQGEFGNLLRVSKTHDHWELSILSGDGVQTRLRFNTQRDQAASPRSAIEIRSGVGRERLFGSVAAWLNNELVRGQPQRLTCEWLTDNKRLYLVQIDEEDEDVAGINPFQIRIGPVHRPDSAGGFFLAPAEGEALQAWDKLKVLEELWEPDASHKPTLFYVPLSLLSNPTLPDTREKLEQDFRSLIGPDNIVVRTSGRAGSKKLPNLPRTECLSPAEAADWCLAERNNRAGGEIGLLDDLAFVAHRFVPAAAGAWARAVPDGPVVEVHSLWGLPDALQYFPYDIWEIHLPTEVATEYPDYKPNMLLPREEGGWEYVRIKNELARSLSIGRRDAIDVATRTAAIARRLERACHVMWFVGCADRDGARFNLPWYWTEAHEAEKNVDRSSYRTFKVSDSEDLAKFRSHGGPRTKQALELSPTELGLMRDTPFIEAVGKAAKEAGVPVILAGSTLAHAYFQLRKQGCAVITPGEKEHSRVRRSTMPGKLVRDKIPARITERREAELTRKVPSSMIKGFLLSKLLEEALEVRNAEDRHEKITELADLYEVVRALAHAEEVSIDDVVAAADVKKAQSGGFDDGLVLLQTGILGRDRSSIQDSDRSSTQVLARKVSEEEYEIPFSFFGFMELDQPRSLTFGNLGVRLYIVLKADRIELRASKQAEQLELPLDLTVEADDWSGE